MRFDKFHDWVLKSVAAVMVALFLVFAVTFFVPGARSAITQIAGLAVAQSGTLWNNLKDAAVGDNQTNGVGAFNLYLYDGTNFDRARGTTANGLNVNVTNSLTVAGDKTPADNYANPTDHLGTWALLGIFDGTNWDRWLESVHGDNLTTASGANVAAFQYIHDGTNWDRFDPYAGASFYAIKKTDLTTVSFAFTFGITSMTVQIETPATNTDDVCIDWIGGTAVCPAANTAGDDRISPGRTITLDNYARTSINAIAASGTQTLIVRAWR